jgi:opacity protein-like surface antigen
MMNMKRLIYILFILCAAVVSASASATVKPDRKPKKLMLEKAEAVIEDTLTNEYLDTIKIHKKLELNDYSMIGLQYGVGLSRVSWNPRQDQDMLLMPVNAGVLYTRYGKMFGYMPYFGFQAGVLYTTEGYQFKHNEEDNYTNKIEGAEKAVMEVLEVPLLGHMHVDFWNFKIFANIGCYAGYRLSIERFPGKTGNVSEDVAHSFIETDNRFDFGLKGGVGVGLVFDPIEIHIKGMYKHSFSSLYEPDYHSKYFYRYAYPYNFIISAGLHFHLTKRTGQTKSQLKKLAKDMVYGN